MPQGGVAQQWQYLVHAPLLVVIAVFLGIPDVHLVHQSLGRFSARNLEKPVLGCCFFKRFITEKMKENMQLYINAIVTILPCSWFYLLLRRMFAEAAGRQMLPAEPWPSSWPVGAFSGSAHPALSMLLYVPGSIKQPTMSLRFQLRGCHTHRTHRCRILIQTMKVKLVMVLVLITMYWQECETNLFNNNCNHSGRQQTSSQGHKMLIWLCRWSCTQHAF